MCFGDEGSPGWGGVMPSALQFTCSDSTIWGVAGIQCNKWLACLPGARPTYILSCGNNALVAMVTRLCWGAPRSRCRAQRMRRHCLTITHSEQIRNALARTHPGWYSPEQWNEGMRPIVKEETWCWNFKMHNNGYTLAQQLRKEGHFP